MTVSEVGGGCGITDDSTMIYHFSFASLNIFTFYYIP